MSDESPVHVILGGSGGIGSATARRLAATGARLVLGARDADRLNAIASEIGAEAVPLDVTRPDGAETAVQRAVERFGRIDGLAHCVGSILLKPAHLTTDAEWADTLAINLTSAFYAVRAAVKAMTGGGSIVLISTVAARIGLKNHEAIAAAKAGLHGLTLAAAATYAAKQIRVNCVAPGLVETPLAARITGNEAARKASLAMHPLGRLGRADDVASAVAWLLDPANSWVTGQILGTDGGLASVGGR